MIATNKGSATQLGTGQTSISAGGATDTWGESWTAADINASNFGVALAYSNVNVSARTVSVDYARIAVYYTDPTTGNVNWTVGIDASDAGGFKISTGTTHSTNAPFKVGNDGHVKLGGGASPTVVGGCGTGAYVSGNDTRGTIVMGTGNSSSFYCEISFATPYNSTPFCLFDVGGFDANGNTGISSSFLVDPSFDNANIKYICLEY